MRVGLGGLKWEVDRSFLSQGKMVILNKKVSCSQVVDKKSLQKA